MKDADGGKKIKKPKKITLQEVLARLAKEDLIDIVMQVARDDRTLEQRLIVRYASGTSGQELEACRSMIRAIVKKYMNRGFIHYREVYGFTAELSEVADKARTVEDPLLALDIAFLLMEEAVEAFQYADDSDGEIGSLVSYTLEIVEEVAQEESENNENAQKAAAFEKILAYADHEMLDDWTEYKIQLLHSCACFAKDETFREQLRMKVSSMMRPSDSSYSARYENESLLQLQLRLIEDYGTKEEEKQFIHERLQYPSFRKQMLEHHLKENENEKVIELAKEGERQDSEYPGLVKEWKQFRYKAYKNMALEGEQKALAKEFLMEGDFVYYKDLKQLASGDFDLFYNELKQELKSSNSWHKQQVFLKLIEREQDYEELMAFVKEQPAYIEKYAQALKKRYPNEVEAVFKVYIESQASIASNRKMYKEVCVKLAGYKKVASPEKQAGLIRQLMETYQKRPAFLDELGKVK